MQVCAVFNWFHLPKCAEILKEHVISIMDLDSVYHALMHMKHPGYL